MANLRIKRIAVTSNTNIRAQFTSNLSLSLNKDNILITPMIIGVPVPQITSVTVRNDLIDIKTTPLTPLSKYEITFKNGLVKFSSRDSTQYLPNDQISNSRIIVGLSEPPDIIRSTLIEYLKDNVYNIDYGTVVKSIVDSQGDLLSRALHDIGQVSSDNYLEVLIKDEVKTRGEGAYDRLNEEGAYEIVRVGLTTIESPGFTQFLYDEFPSDPITLQQTTIGSEVLSAGNGAGTFNGLILTVENNPVTILHSVTINYQAGGSYTYPIETFGYRMFSNRYDSVNGSNLVTLQDNQFALNQDILENPLFNPPGVGDLIYVNYSYKSLGRIIDETSLTITQVIKCTREVCASLVTSFNLNYYPVVDDNGLIPSIGWIEFLNPFSNPPFSEPHPAFIKELRYNLAGLPAAPGEYCVDYSSGKVFVYGESTNDGTGFYPPAATYNYKKTFDNKNDYAYNSDTYEVVSLPLRDLRGEPATISFNFQQTLVPGVDFVAQVHNESIDERIENRLATLNSLFVLNPQITNVFRIYNETSGEIYPIQRYGYNKVYFTYSTPPRIEPVTNERVSFTRLTNELLIKESEIINTSSVRIFKFFLQNNNIMSATDDVIGSSINSSTSFSRSDVFDNEIYYDFQTGTEFTNTERISVGEYCLNYNDGILYVGVSNTQLDDVGTINYTKSTISTLNKHIISVSQLFNSLNLNASPTKIINYNSFSDSEIQPSSFDISDERFLNGDESLPYIVDNNTIAVSNDISSVRGVFDLDDLRDSASPTNFGIGSTFAGNVITLPSGADKQETLTIGGGNVIAVTNITIGAEISEVNDVIRVSDGYSLWDNTGTFSGYNINLPGINSPSPGQQVLVIYKLKLNSLSTPIVDYSRGNYYVNYSYLADEILVSYEYGDNVIDFRESTTLDPGEEYYVTYKVGALRDSLLNNFGSLVNLPRVQSFDIDFNREIYRNCLQGALQSFTKGPTIPAIKLLVEFVTKIEPEIIESIFAVWSLGISNLFQNAVDYTDSIEIVQGKYDGGALINKPDQSITFPVSSNLRLEEGTLETWIIPEWNGLDNDSELTFNSLKKNDLLISPSSIYIGATSFNPTFDINGNFKLNRFNEDVIGLPDKVYTEAGMFIYYDDIIKEWRFLVKDTPDGYQYTGTIFSSGEFYNVKPIEDLFEPTDSIRTFNNRLEFVLNIDSNDLVLDGYTTNDGYVSNYSFDGFKFMSDNRHYIFDFAESKSKNRFSIYKDGSGYLNFEIWDNARKKYGNRKYAVSTDISSWAAGQKYHIGVSWRLNSYDRRDEMHLFVNGFEVPNILMYGGKPRSEIGDIFRTAKPEIVLGAIPKVILTSNDLETVAGSNIVFSSSTDFGANGIVPGDTITIQELFFTTYTIASVSSNTLVLSSPMPATLNDARFSTNEFSAVVSTQIDLYENVVVSLFDGVNEIELPGLRAEYPGYSISKDMLFNNILTIQGPANAGDLVYIRSLGKNFRRLKDKVYLWGDTGILKTEYPPPVNLNEVSIIPVILPLLNLNPSNSVVSPTTFTLSGLVPTAVSNTTEGRKLAVRITGGNVDFSTAVTVTITGTSTGGPSEILSFTEAGIQATLNKWQTITDITVVVKPFNLTRASISVEVKELYTVTYSDGNVDYPIIRFSYQTTNGAGAYGSGNTVYSTTPEFIDSNVGNTLVLTAPPAVVGNYTILSRIDQYTITISPALPTAFTSGTFKILNSTFAGSGFQNGFFYLEKVNEVGASYELPKGWYELDYSTYLQISIDNVQNQIAHIGSDFNNQNQANAVIDEFRILSKELTDLRIGEVAASGVDYITQDFNARLPFTTNKYTLMLLHFDTKPFRNDSYYYRIRNKDYIATGDSVNKEFEDSLVAYSRGYEVLNDGKFSTASAGTIEFWVSPKFETYNDANERYYFDAAASTIEVTTSLTKNTVLLGVRASEILSVRLETDKENVGKNYFVGGTLGNDKQSITLGSPLPGQNTRVKITYIPNGTSGDRISIYKSKDNLLNFRVVASGNVYAVSQQIFWKRDTWHRVMCTFKFNEINNKDEIRMFVDGEEIGIITFGSGALFGSGFVFGQNTSPNSKSYLEANIDFKDTINYFYIGSSFEGTQVCLARIDNLKISNNARAPIYVAGQAKDVYFQNQNVALPAIEDAFTTYLMNFNTIITLNKDFAIVRDAEFGIFNFDLNIFDSFDIVKSDMKVQELLEELILALKPATAKVNITIVD